jgi:hypothetical protein
MTMTQAHSTKAAELHEATAKSHRVAAEHFSKSQPDSAKTHFSRALMQSTEAREASVKAHAAELSAATKTA